MTENYYLRYLSEKNANVLTSNKKLKSKFDEFLKIQINTFLHTINNTRLVDDLSNDELESLFDEYGTTFEYFVRKLADIQIPVYVKQFKNLYKNFDALYSEYLQNNRF